MTTPGDTPNKNQRKVLTLNTTSKEDHNRRTLTVPNKLHDNDKTIIVIKKKPEQIGRNKTFESSTTESSKEPQLLQSTITSNQSNKQPVKNEVLFEKHQIKTIFPNKRQEVADKQPEQLTTQVSEKQPIAASTYVRPSHFKKRQPSVNFDLDIKKKFKDLNIRDKKDEPIIELKPETPAPQVITAAASVKQIEANRKKVVTHTKNKQYIAEGDSSNSNNKTKQKQGQYRLSAAHITKIANGEADSSFHNRNKKKKKNNIQHIAAEKILRDITIGDVITVSELASKMSEKGSTVVKTLLKMGVMATINQLIDVDTAELVATELGHRVERITQEAVMKNLIGDNNNTTQANIERRAPIVTVMGHVDHGKTSLLDALKKTDVAGKERGGITQHIGAYSVHLPNNQAITFLDTPGHEAFSAMRMRGAKITDIIILVVAADDGIKAQTIEAISHAKAAKVPIIVAINKMDKPGAKFELVKQSLLQYDIIPDDLGGDVMVIGISAVTGFGLDDLIETILLQADLLDLKAESQGRAKGYIIEARLDKIKGFTASLIIQSGELKIGDILVAGHVFGRVRTMCDDKGKHIKVAGPSTPVEITGLDSVPVAGDEFVVMQNEKSARELVDILQIESNAQKLLAKTGKAKTLQEMFTQNKEDIKEIALIIKADVHGSAEAILHNIIKLENSEVKIRILHYAAGGINESDVMLAAASKAMIIGFNVRPNANAKEMALKVGVEMKFYSIIYNLLDDIKAIVTNILSPIEREKTLGLVEIRKIFETSKFGKIAGCYVKEGIVKRNASVRVLRNNEVVYTGTITSLKRQKDDAKEVREGFECGITIDGYDNLKTGDFLEVFEIVSEKR